MLTLDEARERLLVHARRTEAESVELADALGRVLVDPEVAAPVSVPPFANSAMDGFAVRAADLPGSLKVIGESAAGASGVPSVGHGTAVRIMTGAPLPPGADAVVPLEEADEVGGQVTVGVTVEPGRYVREAGHDTAAGDRICLPGRLTPSQLAVLASLGIGRVDVRGRPSVAVISTGDELVAPGERLGAGQIYDANGVALSAAVDEAGGRPLLLPRLGDDPRALRESFADAAGRVDLIVTSGGVSVGRHDHVRAVVERLGRIDFWRIAVQPGKPLAVGEIDGTPVIGLPGNPVSALVTFELFVRPLIRAALGLTGDGRRHVSATSVARLTKDRDRRAYLRVRLRETSGELQAEPAGGQASSQLRPMAEADALLVVPEGHDAAEVGERYEAVVLS